MRKGHISMLKNNIIDAIARKYTPHILPSIFTFKINMMPESRLKWRISWNLSDNGVETSRKSFMNSENFKKMIENHKKIQFLPHLWKTSLLRLSTLLKRKNPLKFNQQEDWEKKRRDLHFSPCKKKISNGLLINIYNRA